jgi:hypothetical protein
MKILLIVYNCPGYDFGGFGGVDERPALAGAPDSYRGSEPRRESGIIF